jgi:AcrR family transcriptional regulator
MNVIFIIKSMPQSLKSDIRESIVNSALKLFAKNGFETTTIAQVAKAANISTGNVYRYFRDKEELFYSVLPHDFVKRVKTILQSKVQSAEGLKDLNNIGYNSHHARISAEFLTFSIENRLRLILLLDHSKGTLYESSFQDTVLFLVRLVLRYVKLLDPHKRITREKRRCLTLIYQAYIKNFTEILESDNSEFIRETLNEYSKYHLSGLKALLLE